MQTAIDLALAFAFALFTYAAIRDTRQLRNDLAACANCSAIENEQREKSANPIIAYKVKSATILGCIR